MRFAVNGKRITCTERGLLVEGSVGSDVAEFTFSADWDGLVKTASFVCGSVVVPMLITDNQCNVPSEIFNGTVGNLLAVGVCGISGSVVVYPTIYCDVGQVRDGADLSGTAHVEPEPTLYQQIMAEFEQTNEIAASVRTDADNGVFNGLDGSNGVGISSIEYNRTDSNGNNIYTVTLTNSETYEFTAPRGAVGATGPQGNTGAAGSDATVTAENVKIAGAVMGVKVNSAELEKDIDGKANIDLSGYALKESNYTLIEKIIVGYTLLTAEPYNWNMNYGSYYINNETAISPNYIHVPAIAPWESGKYYAYDANGVSSVVRTQEPSGNAYNFKKLLFISTSPQSPSVGTVYAYINTNKLAIYCANGIHTSASGAIAVGRAEIVNGCLCAEGTGGINSAGGQAGTASYTASYMIALSSITSINISASVTIPAGTVIIIKGVRA